MRHTQRGTLVLDLIKYITKYSLTLSLPLTNHQHIWPRSSEYNYKLQLSSKSKVTHAAFITFLNLVLNVSLFFYKQMKATHTISQLSSCSLRSLLAPLMKLRFLRPRPSTCLRSTPTNHSLFSLIITHRSLTNKI